MARRGHLDCDVRLLWDVICALIHRSKDRPERALPEELHDAVLIDVGLAENVPIIDR
jgi:hypothetical protein